MVSQPDTMPLFANNYWMQMTETRVRWVVLGLPQDGDCADLFENLSEISLKVRKIENFFDSDIGICVISLLAMSKY